MNNQSLQYCEKSTSCINGRIVKTEEPCKTCLLDGEFRQYKLADVGRPAVTRSKWDEEKNNISTVAPSEPGVSSSSSEKQMTTHSKISEPCREATRRWKEAEKDAKIKCDKERQKVINRVLAEYLGNMSPNKTVELPDPSTARTEDMSFEKLGLSSNKSISR